MVTAPLTTVGVSIRNVLIATDFSHYSDAAMRYGFEVARRYQAQPYLVYVTPADEYLLAGPEALMYARDAARRDMLELKAQVKQSLSYEEGKDYRALMLQGSAADSILECAREKRADLIVVGTHGRGGLGKVLMGSVAERVFRHSTVPVLTIGPHQHRRNADPRSILLATNCSPVSECAAAYACSLAYEHRATLSVLHAIERAPDEASGDRERLKRATEEKLANLIGPAAEGLNVCYRVLFGQPVTAILRTATACDAGYIVLGVHQRSGLLDRLKWPTAYSVVRDASCPVLTVRDGA